MSIDVTKKTVEPVHIVSVRTKTTLAEISKTIGEAYGRIMGHLQKAGVAMAGAPLALYHGEEWDEDNIDLEPAVPIAAPTDVPHDMKCRLLPKEDVMSVVHKGPYSTLHETYAKFHEYMKANGLVSPGPVREIYLNDPQQVKPEDILTEILFPVG